MYNLYKLEENRYQIHSSRPEVKAMDGTLLAILTYCTYALGFKTYELETALLDMLNNDKNASHFGVNRTFIYSFDRKTKKAG